VVERLERAEIYWLATAEADGTPHLIPIWGAWVDGHWYVEGGPTRWQRNLRANPRMAIHVQATDKDVVIVEGSAVERVAPERDLADRILAGYAKYRPGYEASADHWTDGGLWELHPTKAFAWTVFPDDMTRYTFDAG
jgi:nitroimidazol reductase NimA-like FMN-containing flavoprotein (pyridoxamine 5'-phosphate oxidase superfamily)